MIRIAVIIFLSTLTTVALASIPLSYVSRTFNNSADWEDGALQDLILQNKIANDRFTVRYRGVWPTYGAPLQRRVVLGLSNGKAILGFIDPQPAATGNTKPTGFAWQRSLLGIHASKYRPHIFRTCGTGYAQLSPAERHRHNLWYASRNADIYSLAVPLPMLCAFLGAFPIIAFRTGYWRRHLRRRRGLCVKCGYNLAGNTTGTCPECGTPGDLDPPS